MSSRRLYDSYGLQGPLRTCYWYECKKSRTTPSNVTPSNVCARDEVLRCIKYENEGAVAPYVGQRKNWSQYIHAGKGTKKTVRSAFPPYSASNQLFLEELPEPYGVSSRTRREPARRAKKDYRRIRKPSR